MLKKLFQNLLWSKEEEEENSCKNVILLSQEVIQIVDTEEIYHKNIDSTPRWIVNDNLKE